MSEGDDICQICLAKGYVLAMTESPLQISLLDAALFDGWREDLRNRWAHLRSESGKVTLQEALAAVSRILDKRLSEGLSTAEQFVLGLFDGGRLIGSFWLEVKGDKGFLYDVVLNEKIDIESLRSVIENEALSRGALELRVNVFAGDQLLKSLTSSDAYRTVNSQMWLLDSPEEDHREVDSDLVLRAMTGDEFPDYRQWQIDNYAAEKVAAGRCSPEEALVESIEEVAKLLPDGLDSEGQFIFVAELKNEKIGTIWMNINKELEVPRAFGVYIEIEQSLRGQGLGRELMYATRLECRKLGAKGFALSVFGHNSIARNLYESFGFEVTEVSKKRVFTS